MAERSEAELKALIEAAMRGPGFVATIGTRLVRFGKGECELALATRPDLLQFTGAVHGGVIGALADHAAGGAASTLLPAGQIAVTAEYKINFLAPAKGEEIVARARVERAGRSLVVVGTAVFARRGGEETKCAVALVTLTPVPFG
ncbi:MAG: PaaI family thioesterase [Candidatus Odyssella sp.]|nr:PaaI family thioesterase [Candidatus Odyssella sp.]